MTHEGFFSQKSDFSHNHQNHTPLNFCWVQYISRYIYIYWCLKGVGHRVTVTQFHFSYFNFLHSKVFCRVIPVSSRYPPTSREGVSHESWSPMYCFDFYKGSKVHPSLTPLHPPCPFWIKCRKMFLKCQIWSPSFHRVGSKRLKSVSKFGWVTSFILDHAGRWKRNKKKKQHGQIDCPNCKMDFSKLQNRFLQNEKLAFSSWIMSANESVTSRKSGTAKLIGQNCLLSELDCQNQQQSTSAVCWRVNLIVKRQK